MATMLVTYRTPADPEAFKKHYFEVHVPLAKQLPGLQSYSVSTVPIVAISGEPAYLVGTLKFSSVAAIKQAFASDIGAACAADRRKLAPNDDDCSILIFDEESL